VFEGVDEAQFSSPTGIATYENNIYVVDSHLNSIKKVDSDGNFILKWGEEGSEDGKFFSPHGIEIDSEGVVYVVDTNNYRIQKFTTDGEFLSSFGSYGVRNEGLRAPEDITIYENNVYVSDPRNYKIVKFTSDGIFLKSIDYNVGGFPMRPYGLVSDLDGNVYIADPGKHRIVKIDSEGYSLTVWGKAGNEKAQFIEPIGIALNNLGYIFVTDTSNNRIQKFQTPIVVEIQEALAAEQAEKLKELAYSENVETEDNDQNMIPEKSLVRDLTKPVLVAPKDRTIEAIGSLTPVDIGKAMAMDENGIQFLINNAPEVFNLGQSIIIWTAVDNSGNSSFATQEVNVIDTTASTILSEIEYMVGGIVSITLTSCVAKDEFPLLSTAVHIIIDWPKLNTSGALLIRN
jgi:DNA-binding beta-propeller fold protein YncE